jgi:hypothetical protein
LLDAEREYSSLARTDAPSVASGAIASADIK